MDFLITCKEGYETILSRETALYGLNAPVQGRGWLLARGDQPTVPFAEFCFAYAILESPFAVEAPSVNSLVGKLADEFMQHIGTQRIDAPWARLFFSSGDERLIQHAGTVEKCWLEKAQKKMSRVVKLSRAGIPSGASFSDGFFVHFTGFNKALVSFRALSQGQRRMKMDPQAPSRSYLKIEEAFHVLGQEPGAHAQVIDLGAAPGGWSHGALRRGAYVTAIDNGPLREPVKSHPNIRHLQADALTYRPDRDLPVDWLLCDVLEDPDVILVLLRQWLGQKWCRRFVVNLKVGRLDPVMLIKRVRNIREGLAPLCQSLCVRHLYHDREEVTLMGEARG